MLPGTKYGFYTLGDTICYSQDFTTWDGVNIGDKIDYEIQIRPCGANGGYGAQSFYPYETIYYGGITVVGGVQKIILNDIIEPHMYDHSYLSPNTPNSTTTSTTVEGIKTYSTKTPPVKLGASTENEKFFIDVNIKFAKYNKNYEILGVLQFYAPVGYQIPKIIPLSYDESVSEGGSNQAKGIVYVKSTNIHSHYGDGYNVLYLSNNIPPRIPVLEKADRFWFGIMGMHSTSQYNTFPTTTSIYNGDRKVTDIEINNPLFTYNFGGDEYVNLVSEIDCSHPLDFGRISNFVGERYDTLATVDSCPSDYYLIWMDRTGAYQCQPFTKKVIHSESISNTTITNEYEETRPAITSIQNKWTLNSDWLNENEYKAYESIFVSPYLYLYNTKLDEGYWVNCDTKQWTSKNHKNNKGLFNLSLTVSSIATQNITY